MSPWRRNIQEQRQSPEWQTREAVIKQKCDQVGAPAHLRQLAHTVTQAPLWLIEGAALLMCSTVLGHITETTPSCGNVTKRYHLA